MAPRGLQPTRETEVHPEGNGGAAVGKDSHDTYTISTLYATTVHHAHVGLKRWSCTTPKPAFPAHGSVVPRKGKCLPVSLTRRMGLISYLSLEQDDVDERVLVHRPEHARHRVCGQLKPGKFSHGERCK